MFKKYNFYKKYLYKYIYMDNFDYEPKNRGRSSRSGATVDTEVQKLLRNNPANSGDLINKLRMRLNDDNLVDQIQKEYVSKHTGLLKKARKFAKLVREKYGDRNYPFHILLEKAYVFKVKHSLSNEEFGEFQRIYEQELVGLKAPDVYSYANNMVKLLGGPNTVGLGGKLEGQDYKYVQEIVKMHSVNKVLHSQVFLQSITYSDCAFQALTGKYDQNAHNPLDHVHPVVAALFIPKIKSLDENLLLANLAKIVATRYNNEPLSNIPDYKLYYDLINDPNDVVCDTRSSVVDVMNRCNVQAQLWNSVLNLRNGQYYGSGFREFIAGVDMCKLNKYDNPDLVYGRYDGTVIKRLLSVFSFRPTLVACTPVYANNFSTNPYQQNIRPVVTSVPMINLRLAPSMSGSSNTIRLKDALTQHQLMIENGQMMWKHVSLIYSSDVLFFYVDRRTNTINLNDLRPYNVAKQPSAISGFERINTDPVAIDQVLQVRDTKYRLRSVVLSEINDQTTEGKIVVGSSALIVSCPNDTSSITQNYYYYNPVGVVKGYKNASGSVDRDQPVTRVPYSSQPNWDDEYTFCRMAETRGVIFMYQAVDLNEKATLLNMP
jgi:hypothetical protein